MRLIVKPAPTPYSPHPVIGELGFSNTSSTLSATTSTLHIESVQLSQSTTSVPSVSCQYIAGNGTGVSIQPVFSVSNVQVTNSNYVVTEAQFLASDLANVYYKVQGTGFLPGTTVRVNDMTAFETVYVSQSELHVRGPQLPQGTYAVSVLRPTDGALREIPFGLSYDPAPVWSTQAALGVYDGVFNIQLQAPESNGSTITYNSTTPGSLPLNSTLYSNGALQGNNVYSSTTTFAFDVEAIDEQSQRSTRTFSLVYSKPPVWVTDGSLSVPSGQVFSIPLLATSDSPPVVYANTNALPPTTTLSGNTLSGNISASSIATYAFTLSATNAYAQSTLRQFTLRIDPYSYPTNGLIGLYTGSSYTGTQWTDQSGLNNHAVIGGSGFSTETLNNRIVLTGTTATTVQWPAAILPSTFTLIHFTRYKPSGTKRRIIQGAATNWLNGHWNGNSGVAHHNGWIGVSASTVPEDWVLSTSTGTTYRANQNLIGSTGAGSPNYDRLYINSGANAGESSDWMCALLMAYNRVLSAAEVKQVEAYVMSRYVPLVEPVFKLSAKALTYSTNTNISSWVSTGTNTKTATAYNVGGASLPLFDVASKSVQLNGTSTTVGSYFDFGSTTWNLATTGGFTFVGYVKFTSTMSWERLFDFGNGQIDNFFFGRNSTTQQLRASVNAAYQYDTPALIQNNVWLTYACRLKNEGGNVWRWMVWIDGRWYSYATTYAGVTNRTVSNSYIGRSNWVDAYSAAHLRELWFFDTPLTDQEVWRTISVVQEGYS